jgi:hypothetical protein
MMGVELVDSASEAQIGLGRRWIADPRAPPSKPLNCWPGVGAPWPLAGFFGWQYKVPLVYPAISQANEVLSRYTLPWLEKTFGHVSPQLVLLFNIAANASVLFVLSMTLIPALERLIFRDLIRRGERQGKKIEAIRDKIQFEVEKKNHAR